MARKRKRSPKETDRISTRSEPAAIKRLNLECARRSAQKHAKCAQGEVLADLILTNHYPNGLPPHPDELDTPTTPEPPVAIRKKPQRQRAPKPTANQAA